MQLPTLPDLEICDVRNGNGSRSIYVYANIRHKVTRELIVGADLAYCVAWMKQEIRKRKIANAWMAQEMNPEVS